MPVTTLCPRLMLFLPHRPAVIYLLPILRDTDILALCWSRDISAHILHCRLVADWPRDFSLPINWPEN